MAENNKRVAGGKTPKAPKGTVPSKNFGKKKIFNKGPKKPQKEKRDPIEGVKHYLNFRFSLQAKTDFLVILPNWFCQLKFLFYIRPQGKVVMGVVPTEIPKGGAQY